MRQASTDNVELLTALYVAEKRCLLPRLAETSNFTTGLSDGDRAAIHQIIAETFRQQERLADRIDRSGGGVPLVSPDPTTTNLHYLELRAILPRVIESVARLVDAYERALARRENLSSATVEALDEALRLHRTHLGRLRQIQDRVAPLRIAPPPPVEEAPSTSDA